MEKKLSVLVTGATGHQGGAVARHLLRRGHHVRALTRKPDLPAAQELKRQGAELSIGSFDDRNSLIGAARGMDAVFGMSTPFEEGMEAEVRQGIALADAAQTAGVAHFVFSSVASADRHTGIPHFESKYRIEQRIKAMDLPYTIVGPVFFMENFLNPLMLPELQKGRLAMPMPPSRKLQQIALDDIGAFVTQVLEDRDRLLGHRIDIASDELSGARTAEILSRAVGRPIEYVEVPLGEMRAVNPDYAKMFEWFIRVGYDVNILALRRKYPEVPWHTFEDWARNRDWSFLKEAVTR